MAHMVRYSTDDGDRLAPSVTFRVKAKTRNVPDDMMLVSALLNMRYSGTFGLRLPPGVRRVIKPSTAYTDETSLFTKDFQRFVKIRSDGIVSPLPLGHSAGLLGHYTVWRLYMEMVWVATSMGDSDAEQTILSVLKSRPVLSGIDRDNPTVGPEVVHGGNPTVEGPT